jgi:hypothetical protein
VLYLLPINAIKNVLLIMSAPVLQMDAQNAPVACVPYLLPINAIKNVPLIMSAQVQQMDVSNVSWDSVP